MNAQSQVDAMAGTLDLEREARNQKKAFLDAEYARQAALTNQNRQFFDRANTQFGGNVPGEMAAKAAGLLAGYNPQITGSPIRNTAPRAIGIVADSEAAFNQDAQGRVTNLASALANLRAFNDVMTDKGRGIAASGQDITQGLDFMRGSRGVLGSEIQTAQVSPLAYQLQAARSMSPLGDLLKGAGQLGMMYGLVDPARTGGVKNTTPAPIHITPGGTRFV